MCMINFLIFLELAMNIQQTFSFLCAVEFKVSSRADYFTFGLFGFESDN